MNNEKDMMDDILDESLSNVSKPQPSSNFQMPTDITNEYNKSVEGIVESKQPAVNTGVPQDIPVTPVQPTINIENKPLETVVVEPTISTDTKPVEPTVTQPTAVEPVVQSVTPAVATSAEQVQVVPQAVQPVAEQTSVLPVVENSVIPEKPVKKKGKVLKIVILSVLLLITLSALAIYIIGTDVVINFIKSLI